MEMSIEKKENTHFLSFIFIFFVFVMTIATRLQFDAANADVANYTLIQVGSTTVFAFQSFS